MCLFHERSGNNLKNHFFVEHFESFDSNIKRILGELISHYSPRNHQKIYGFMVISEGIEVN